LRLVMKVAQIMAATRVSQLRLHLWRFLSTRSPVRDGGMPLGYVKTPQNTGNRDFTVHGHANWRVM
jgi:hypothetical protein